MLLINGIRFKKYDFGEHAVLLRPVDQEQFLPIQISKTAEFIYELSDPEIKEVITGIADICLVLENKQAFNFKKLEENTPSDPALKLKLLAITVDFSQGLDWERVQEYSNLDKESCIELLINTTFQFQMCGFIPGFVYLSGLPNVLEIPRLGTPRMKVEPGSIGIGGKQFGIYNIESPGGWNIIGKTDLPLFNKSKIPPLDLKVGDKIKLIEL